jgi:hypothetical protein
MSQLYTISVGEASGGHVKADAVPASAEDVAAWYRDLSESAQAEVRKALGVVESGIALFGLAAANDTVALVVGQRDALRRRLEDAEAEREAMADAYVQCHQERAELLDLVETLEARVDALCVALAGSTRGSA